MNQPLIPQPTETWESFAGHSWKTASAELVYRLKLPQKPGRRKKHPVVLFLHGAGERGTDNWKQVGLNPSWHRIWSSEAAGKYRDGVILLAPQCPESKMWTRAPWVKGPYDLDTTPFTEELDAVRLLLLHVLEQYQGDPDRVYITGLSMGGYGTWDLITRFPELFAAAVPICGGGSPRHAGRIAKLPIWAFHGTKDETVPPVGSRSMVEALQQAGSDVKYTEFPTAGHNSWDPAYATPDLISWLVSKKRAAGRR